MVEYTTSAHFGNDPYAKPYDDLPLPGEGNTIGKTDDISLRRILHKLGVPEAHTAGRNVLCERYRQMLAKIGANTSDPAIIAFLEKHRD